MRRREFLGALGGAVGWPLAARAQQPAMPVIGYINAAFAQRQLAAFLKRLGETGYVADQNVAIESGGRRAIMIGCKTHIGKLLSNTHRPNLAGSRCYD